MATDTKSLKFVLQLLFVIVVYCGPVKYSGKVLLVGYDGFRWDYLTLIDTPNFDRFILEGSSAPFINNVFTSITFPSMYTIVTGLYPESHGIVGYTMYDPVFNDTWVSANDEPRWYNDGEPIWVTAGQAGLRTGSYMWLGGAVEIRNYRPDFWLEYNQSHSFEERVEEVIRWFSEEDVDVVTLYFHEPDSTGHSSGPAPGSTDTLRMIQEMDLNTGYLLRRLEDTGLSDTVNVIITSDHGMTETSLTDQVIELYTFVEQQDIYMIADEGAVANILPREGRTQAVFDALKNAHPNMTVYLKHNLPQRWHFQNHRRIHPVIAVADEGWIIVSNVSKWQPPLNGMHGYDNELMSMKPFFLAKGPNIRVNYESPPFSQVDIYTMMCELLDVMPSPHNGSLEVAGLMLQPTPPVLLGSVRSDSPLVLPGVLNLITISLTCILTFLP